MTAVVTPFTKLFGKATTLKGKGGDVQVSSLGGETHKYILIYFSAHWCGPCRRFTPLLAKLYTDLRATRQDFEIVFVSSDNAEDEMDEYYKEMPWLALPYSFRKEKERLSKKFECDGIPCLVVLDHEGKVINPDAVAEIRKAEGSPEKFPWKQRGLFDVLADAPILDKSGKKVTVDDLKAMDCFALYFSAHWCPPCRAFTPQLSSIYRQLKEGTKKNTEIIFVSADQNVEEFLEYWEEMPFARIDFQHPTCKELSKLLKVDGIPSLCTVKPSGDIINKDARGAAADDLSGELYPWAPAALGDVEDLVYSDAVVKALNNNICFIFHANGSSTGSTQMMEFKAAGTSLCPTHNAKNVDRSEDFVSVNFLVTPANEDGLFQRVVQATQAQIPPAGKALILAINLTSTEKEVFFGDITKDTVTHFAEKFIAKQKD